MATNLSMVITWHQKADAVLSVFTHSCTYCIRVKEGALYLYITLAINTIQGQEYIATGWWSCQYNLGDSRRFQEIWEHCMGRAEFGEGKKLGGHMMPCEPASRKLPFSTGKLLSIIWRLVEILGEFQVGNLAHSPAGDSIMLHYSHAARGDED